MFKKFVIPSLASAVSSGVISSHSGTNSSSSKSFSKGDEELVTKSEVPTLLRRHSFGIPQDNAMLEPPTGDSTEISIDPFEISTLRRSKSLHFEISKKSSLGNLKKRPAKSVRFNETSLKPSRFLTGNGPESKDNSESTQNMETQFSKFQNSFQQFFQIGDNDQPDGYEKVISDSIVPLDNPNSEEPENGGDDNWFDEVAVNGRNLNLNSLKDNSNSIDPKLLSLNNTDITENSSKIPFNSNTFYPDEIGFDNYEIKASQEEEFDAGDYSFSTNSDDEFNSEKEQDRALGSDSSLKGLLNVENLQEQRTKELLSEISLELELENESCNDVPDCLNLILSKVKSFKSLLQEKDLTVAELSAAQQSTNDTREAFDSTQEENTTLKTQLGDYQQSLNILFESNCEMEMKLHQSLTEKKRLADKAHQLESQVLLKGLRDSNEFQNLKQLENILAEKTGATDSFDKHLVQILEEKDELENTMYDLVSKNEELTDTLTSSQQESHQLEAKLDHLVTANEDLISLQNTNKQSHQAEVNIYLQEINKLTGSLQEKTETNIQHEQEILKLNNNVTELNTRNNQLIDSNTQLKMTLSSVTAEKSQALDYLGKAQQEIKWLQKNCDEQSQIIKAEGQKNKEVSSQFMEKNNRIQELEVSVMNLKSEMNQKIELATDLGMKLNSVSDKLEAASHENLELTEGNQYITDRYNELAEILESLKSEFTALEDDKSQLAIRYKRCSASNELLARKYMDLVGNLKIHLKPMMYKESISYLTQILRPIQSVKVFDQKDLEVFKEINNFICKAVKDLVFNYLENEKALEKEIANKENVYEQVFQQVSAAFFGKFGISEPAKQLSPQGDIQAFSQEPTLGSVSNIISDQKKEKSKLDLKDTRSKLQPSRIAAGDSDFNSTSESEFELSGSGSLSTNKIPGYLNKSYKMKTKQK